MPHKHKRRQNDTNTYDLPPSMIAKSLPVRDSNAKSWKKDKNKNNKNNKKNDVKPAKTNPSLDARPKKTLEDDTPREFRRLMQFQQSKQQASKPAEPKENNNKKRKRDADNANDKSATAARKKKSASDTATAAAAAATEAAASESKTQVKPKILPGEKMSDFVARVDREMPLSAMKRSGKTNDPNMPNIREERQTKHEKHLRRLQKMWREEEKQILEREQAEREDREAEMEEQLELWKEWETEAGKAKAKKKGGKKKGKGGNNLDNDPDPWAKLNKKERVNKPANPFDVAQAPPQLKKPREIFKVRGGAKVDVANVPAAVGSLRRREELATERRNIVEEYRRLMAEKRQ